MNRIKYILYSLLTILITLPITLSAQESVRVPQQLSVMDQIFHDVEKALEMHNQLRGQKVAQMQAFKRQFESETENQQLRALYHAQFRRAEAEVLQLDYQYYKNVKRLGQQAVVRAAEFSRLVKRTDFGENVAVEYINEIDANVDRANIRIRNQNILREYGRLTREESRWLANQADFQNQMIAMWLNDRRWYSTRLNEVRHQRSQLNQFVDLALMMRSYADDLIQEADSKINTIRVRVRQLREKANSSLT